MASLLASNDLVSGGRAVGRININVVFTVGPVDADEGGGTLCGIWHSNLWFDGLVRRATPRTAVLIEFVERSDLENASWVGATAGGPKISE